MSRVCSATIFFNRAFSFCSALSSLAISGCLPPAAVRLFGDLQDLADRGDLLALVKSNVRLAALLNNLIGRVSCLLHLQRILSGLRPDAILSLNLVQTFGGSHLSPTHARLHPNRAFGRDCHHRYLGGDVAAGAWECPGEGSPGYLHIKPAPDRDSGDHIYGQ